MEPGDAELIKGGTLAEGTEGLSRRGFMRAAGLSLIGAAAAGGALSLAGCSSDNAQGGVAVENKGGCGDFNESLYTGAFPVKTRNVPVIDVESGIVRQATSHSRCAISRKTKLCVPRKPTYWCAAVVLRDRLLR